MSTNLKQPKKLALSKGVVSSSVNNAKNSIDSKKIGLFLKSISGADYIYMRQCMAFREGVNDLIKTYMITKDDFCKRFKIKPQKYNDYVMGNYNYTLQDMACLSASFNEFEAKKQKEKPISMGTTSTDC